MAQNAARSHSEILQRDVATIKNLEAARACKCAKFLPFRCLPVELRLKIWKAALPDPQIIRIGFNAAVDHEDMFREDVISFYLRSYTHVENRAVTLLACRESRQVALESLCGSIPVEIISDQIHFHRRTHDLDEPPPYARRKIRFDPARDAIFFPDFNILNRVSDIFYGEQLRAAFKDIKKLVIPVSSLKRFMKDQSYHSASGQSFENLQEVFAVMDRVTGKRSYELVELTEGSDPLRPTKISITGGDTSASASDPARDFMLPYYDVAAQIISEGSTLNITFTGLKDSKIENAFVKLAPIVESCKHCIEVTGPFFRRFSELPEKVRLKIWGYTIPSSQFIRVKVYRVGSKQRLQFRLKSDHEPLAILGVDKESRKVALDNYTVCLDSDGIDRKIRCSPDDVLYFYNIEKWFKFRGKIIANRHSRAVWQSFRNVKNLAIDNFTLKMCLCYRMAAMINQFESLETLLLIRSGQHAEKRLAKHRSTLVDPETKWYLGCDYFSDVDRDLNRVTQLFDHFVKARQDSWDDEEEGLWLLWQWNIPKVKMMMLEDGPIICNSCIGKGCSGRRRMFSKDYIMEEGRWYNADGYYTDHEEYSRPRAWGYGSLRAW
ncbi:uncharacterized protein LY89DRAFT_742789 [Mollisia scopiformis]|uniref:2EXR domain-containing protein n=1 Tax=Mollisia scopiformis TaxID=149040 RepID=A0A132B5E4_MOLSC|nr:uncharacterized protein LY89DRAFT_742789 [Mollisia scopiformis]KUJ07561.1 hypothetical protein LY89DRAFT_742789 [Mollisia scopiformis]